MKLRGMTLADLTLTDKNARVDNDGPNTDGPSNRDMHKARVNSDGPQFYVVLNCPCLLFVARHSQVRQYPPLLLCLSVSGPSLSDPAFFSRPLLGYSLANISKGLFSLLMTYNYRYTNL